MSTGTGIISKRIAESPIAIIDFETTGLTPGFDRVVEVSVLRVDPGEQPRLVLDTLVNPMRRMSATDIHGIRDEDVASAPKFSDVAGELLAVISNCVVAAYNVYFDVKFLCYELEQVGFGQVPPHFCLMYMRPMLGLGSRCRLEEACQAIGMGCGVSHVASQDVQACGSLLSHYLQVMKQRGISTFADLAEVRSYKFIKSFMNDPLPDSKAAGLKRKRRFKSRSQQFDQGSIPCAQNPLAQYWDALTAAIADLEITDEEFDYVAHTRTKLGITAEQVRVLHARAFSNAIAQFTEDQWLDDREVEKLRRLHGCLAELGWAPGE